MADERNQENTRRARGDDLRQRQARREALRKKRQAERRRTIVGVIAAAVVLVGCGAGLFYLIRNPQSPEAVIATLPEQTTQATDPTETTSRTTRDPKTVIHIKAAGDLNVTNSVVESGLPAATYDYKRAFLDVSPVLSGADLTVMNFEGNICGEPYGTERTSAPWELLAGLRNVGVDLLQVANSCTINNGLIGMASTLQAIRAAGMEPLGAFGSQAELEETGGFTMVEVEGVKIAFVAFTKGVGGMGMPAGNENLVNLLYKDYATFYKDVDRDRINKILNNVNAAKPDITIALLHWGSEDNDVISSSQESIITLLQKKGVDVILGTHPHRLQEIKYDQVSGNLVAYSLGDFFGDATQSGSYYSIILDIEITKNNDTGITKVTDFSYTPICTVKPEECDGFQRVVRIRQAMYAYENNFVDKVSDSCYAQMEYALKRIENRIEGKYN